MRKPIANIHRPWLPVDYTVPVVAAAQALQRGTATEAQQKLFLKWLIEAAAGTYEEPFYNQNAEGQRDTDFALGRQFVGRQTVKLLKLNLSRLRTIDSGKEPENI